MGPLRLTRLREVMENNGLESLLITGPVNRRYMTGFTGSSGYVFVTCNRAMLLTDFRYMTQALEQAPHFEIIEYKPKMINTLQHILSKNGIRRLGIEQAHISLATYLTYQSKLEGIELIPVSGIVEDLRIIKDKEELTIIHGAAELVDRTFSHIVPFIKPGVSERHLALELELFMRKQGATSIPFDTIVASGERSALPHGVASDRIIQSNEFITLDFGALYNGYCADMTRTVFVGKPTDKHYEVYHIVLEAQLHALTHIRPGMMACEADALARGIIQGYGYGDQFGHSTGHGLGMEVHEYPTLAPSSDTVLMAGMAVTVEPGIYIPGFGGVRIEDDIIITEDGIEILTQSMKQLLVLDI